MSSQETIVSLVIQRQSPSNIETPETLKATIIVPTEQLSQPVAVAYSFLATLQLTAGQIPCSPRQFRDYYNCWIAWVDNQQS